LFQEQSNNRDTPEEPEVHPKEILCCSTSIKRTGVGQYPTRGIKGVVQEGIKPESIRQLIEENRRAGCVGMLDDETLHKNCCDPTKNRVTAMCRNP